MPTFDEEKQKKKLEELRKQEEEELVEVLAESKYNLPYINLAAVPIDNESLRIIPEEESKKLEVGPFKLLGKKIDIAVISPQKQNVQQLKQTLEQKGFEVTYYMASHQSIQKIWSRYAEISLAEQAKAGGLDVSGDVLITIGERIKKISDVESVIKEETAKTKIHKISVMLEIILAGAIAINASDVHIEAEEDDVLVRFRLDGVLQDIMHIDFKTYKFINSRIKLLSGMKITNVAEAQDGRFSIFLKENEVNVRTSTVPGQYGESIVMRILNPESIQVELSELGIAPDLLDIFEKEIRKPNGLILVTGPTGSGKTTTLYAFLRKIYSPDLKIITIEDPVEYHLKGITQTQTDHDKGYDFLAGLRAALRQDPDILMVGEIRDSETAKIAIDASLTGHIVFSTLHTNNAAGVIPRLFDLGVNPKIIPSALSLSIAQRLLRKLCVTCKKEKTPTKEEGEIIRSILKNAEAVGKNITAHGASVDQDIVLWDAVGCEECNNTGYKGRIGVFEAILSDEAVENIVNTNPSEREIKKATLPQGILNMKEDGIINKVLTGVTTLDELKKVVDIFEE
ncbi:hypothetical protein COB64_01925 [Candidatus Wolfebacteria bacterium]|nr:MAG: hypothetical protein COB64_01925 [Candidatus Wolfebacteria bacterium]